MKKKYAAPDISIVLIGDMPLLSASEDQIPGGGNGNGIEAESKGNHFINDWDDEEEENICLFKHDLYK